MELKNRYAKCDKCEYLMFVPEGYSILHPDTGEPMACPKCEEGVMQDVLKVVVQDVLEAIVKNQMRCEVHLRKELDELKQFIMHHTHSIKKFREDGAEHYTVGEPV